MRISLDMLLLVLLGLVHGIAGLNILVFLIGTDPSQRATMEFLAQQLALRHHEVVTVKPILIPEEPRLVKPKLHLVREKTLKNLLPRKLYQPLERAGTGSPWRAAYDDHSHFLPFYAAHNASCERILNSNLMDGLQKDKIDVAIVYAGNPCQLAVSHVLGIPVIYFDQEGLTDETLVASGTPYDLDFPLSHCEYPGMQNRYVGRLIRGFCLLVEDLAQSGFPLVASLVSSRYRNLDGPITQQFANDYTLKKRMKDGFPDVNTLKKRSQLFFVNTDPLIEYERSLPSHVVPVGGVHIDEPRPLFAPWNNSVENKEGTIIVSFGTFVNASSMSAYQAKTIYDALAKLTKYRVFWSTGSSLNLPGIDIENTASHINVTSYIPQNDLLAHKKTKLLITNGGMMSIMEAINYGVPIVGIPLYGTNRHNLNKVQHKGLGLVVNKNELTEAALSKAIKTVLESAKFRTVAKDMSKEFRTRGSTPFERALHFIEHVGKHKSALFFRSQRRNFFDANNLDFLIALFFALCLVGFFAKNIVLKLIQGPVFLTTHFISRTRSTAHSIAAQKKMN